MIRLVILLSIIAYFIYNSTIPQNPSPLPLFPDTGSAMKGSSESVRIPHTLNIYEDDDKLIFERNMAGMMITIFFAIIIAFIGVYRFVFPLLEVILNKDKNFFNDKLTIIYGLTLFVLLSFMLPTTTIIDMEKQKLFQKNILFPKGNEISFSEIESLQIIPKDTCDAYTYTSPRGCGKSYELNVLLNDGFRINITDHFKYNQIKDEANILSNKIKKPLHDFQSNI